MVVKIDGREMRVRKGKKGWGGWTPVSEDEERKNKELCLCPDGSRSWCDDDAVSGLEALQANGRSCCGDQDYYVSIQEQQQVHGAREMASLPAKCRDPARKKVLRKKAQKARRDFDARMGALPRGTVVKKPVVTKLWVNGRATENREEWCEEVRLHCEKCYDETSEKQAENQRGCCSRSASADHSQPGTSCAREDVTW